MKNDRPEMLLKREIKLGKSLKPVVLRWHRNIGMVTAVFVLILAISGISLNHTESLSLDENFVDAPWLLDFYGIAAPDDIRAFPIPSGWITQIGQRTFLNDQELQSEGSMLLGAVITSELIIVAYEQEVLLLTVQGELVDKLTALAGLPKQITAIAVENDQVWINTSEGVFSSDEAFLEWSKEDEKTLPWVSAAEVSTELKQTLTALYRGKGLSYERVMLDLHSGRILGQWGVWLMDTAAMLLIVMSLSGIWLWLRSNRKKSARAK